MIIKTIELKKNKECKHYSLYGINTNDCPEYAHKLGKWRKAKQTKKGLYKIPKSAIFVRVAAKS